MIIPEVNAILFSHLFQLSTKKCESVHNDVNFKCMCVCVCEMFSSLSFSRYEVAASSFIQKNLCMMYEKRGTDEMICKKTLLYEYYQSVTKNRKEEGF